MSDSILILVFQNKCFDYYLDYFLFYRKIKKSENP